MAAADRKDQIKRLVNSMFDDGLLDEQFTQLQLIQDSNSPWFVTEVINLFCEDAEKLLDDLTKALEQPAVDYPNVGEYLHQLKGCSSSIGASRVRQACIDFRQAVDGKNIEGCLRALRVAKHEYSLVRSKFETMVKLERGIGANGSKQQTEKLKDV